LKLQRLVQAKVWSRFQHRDLVDFAAFKQVRPGIVSSVRPRIEEAPDVALSNRLEARPEKAAKWQVGVLRRSNGKSEVELLDRAGTCQIGPAAWYGAR